MKVVLALLAASVLSTPAPAQTPTRANLLDTLKLPVRMERVFGQRIAYYETGPVAAPALVLIPSLTWDAHAWAQNVPELSRSFRVIVIDPLGTGRSDKPMIDYKMDTWTDTFAEFLRVKGIQRAAFVGAVMGGALAVQMALDYPTMVSSIVVAASNSGPGPHEGGARSPMYGPSLKGVRASLREAFFDSTLVTPEVVRARFARRLSANDGYTIQRHVADHRPRYTIEELRNITIPALFVWCREDVTTPLSWGEDFAKALPRGRLHVIEKCGHYPNIEKPAEFNQAVMNFLR
jgi:pimeloyl-ACP methyl ester carboxylesterase